ncbi:hypothetical protein MBR_07176, partial [Metarhizium brunneum ARSEF 3297]
MALVSSELIAELGVRTFGTEPKRHMSHLWHRHITPTAAGFDEDGDWARVDKTAPRK